MTDSRVSVLCELSDSIIIDNTKIEVDVLRKPPFTEHFKIDIHNDLSFAADFLEQNCLPVHLLFTLFVGHTLADYYVICLNLCLQFTS